MNAERHRLTVAPSDARRRLDQFLSSSLPGHSRSYLQKLIRDGQVRLVGASGGSARDEALARAGRAMSAGEIVEVVFPAPEPSSLVPEALSLVILHEDPALIVLDKPAGLVVHPGAGARSGTLVHGLLHHCRDLSGIGGVERPGIVHRLDKETSGVLVVAKNDAAHRDLTRQFQARTVAKTYLALVRGRVSPASGAIDLPIGRDSRRRVKISSRTSSPRDAFTEYRVLEAIPGFSWLEVRPRTGRTHQIRVHLKHLGHPVVGDRVYGGASWKQITDPVRRAALQGFRRLALHARRLAFVHPTTGLAVSFEAPVPEEIEALLEVLRKP